MDEDEARGVGDACICLAVQSAGRAVGRRFDEAFRHLGINNWQFSLLVAISGAVPPTIGRVADDLATDRTTITANLKPLQRRGLVEVVQADPDRRLRRARLTDQGRDVLTQALVCWRRVNGDVLGRLGDVDPETLRSGLLALAAL